MQAGGHRFDPGTLHLNATPHRERLCLTFVAFRGVCVTPLPERAGALAGAELRTRAVDNALYIAQQPPVCAPFGAQDVQRALARGKKDYEHPPSLNVASDAVFLSAARREKT